MNNGTGRGFAAPQTTNKTPLWVKILVVVLFTGICILIGVVTYQGSQIDDLELVFFFCFYSKTNLFQT